jgi:hypothetical protein
MLAAWEFCLRVKRNLPLAADTCMHHHHGRPLFWVCLARHIFVCLFAHCQCILESGFPVRVLEHHEFAIIPLSSCHLLSRTRSFVTVIDAAGNSFFVNTAAPFEGFSDATKIKSGSFLSAGLRRMFVLPTKNPSGYVPDVGTNLCLFAGLPWMLDFEKKGQQTWAGLKALVISIFGSPGRQSAILFKLRGLQESLGSHSVQEVW